LTPACSARAGDVLARAAAVPADEVVTSGLVAPGGGAGCRYTMVRHPGRALHVIVGLDSAPQAYYRLEREVVEYGQNVIWDHQGEGAYPRHIPNLGLDADWFRNERQLVTTDGVRLITITVSGPAQGDARERIAEDLARVYLGRLIAPR
jgi:hypothetical protein